MEEIEPTKRQTLFKTLLPWIIFIVFAGVVSSPYLYFKLNMDLPTKYSIGEIDPKFNITKSEVAKQLRDSENRWESYLGKDIFEYKEGAKLKVNLVYDERQSRIDQLKSMDQSLSGSGNIILDSKNKLAADITAYEADVDKYNAKVDHWNNLGGAPTNIYNEIQREQAALEVRRKAINNTATILNMQVDNYNQDLSQLNNEIEKDQGQLVIEGIFSSLEPKIDIFAYSNSDQLRLTLMHEMGHAMGLDHTKDSKSLMYPVLESQDFGNPSPNETDRTQFENRIWYKLIQILQYWRYQVK